MRKLLFSAVIALASIGCSGKSTDDKAAAKHDLPEISVEEVAAGLAARQLTPVDCNGDKTRKKHGLLPGAILIDDEETFTASVLPADKATKLVFYCGGPGWTASHTGAVRARSMGYTNVYVMSEGSAGWTKAGKPTQPI